MPTDNCGITDPKEWASSVVICLTTESLSAMCSNVLAIAVVLSDRGIWGTTIAHNTDFPISGVPIVILETIQTHSVIILKRRELKTSIALVLPE